MKAHQPTGLGRPIVRFFQQYLPVLRGMSHHTIQSYRDGMILFLHFAAKDCGRRVEALELADITADRVGRFLSFLEIETQERNPHPQCAAGGHAHFCALSHCRESRPHGCAAASARHPVQERCSCCSH